YGDSMERVLYNTIGGARLIEPDGTSFYYSDYNRHEAKKEWYKDKWPCCSGTFPQLSADYGISSYYQSEDGIYVNLFLPSRLTWTRGGTQCTLTQKTAYPKSNTIQLEFAARGRGRCDSQHRGARARPSRPVCHRQYLSRRDA